MAALAAVILLLLLSATSLLLLFLLTRTLARLLRRQARITAARRTHRAKPTSTQAAPPVLAHGQETTLLVVLGSGGHTAEMLTLVSDLLQSGLFSTPPRLVYAVGATDTHSAARAALLHKDSDDARVRAARVDIVVVPRAREVGQGLGSSALASLRCFAAVWRVLADVGPDAVLTNGPANGAVCGVAAVLRGAVCGAGAGSQVVYVESLARVKTLSVSGRVLYHIADRFLVQWPELLERYPEAEFVGRLC